jgi:ribonuclease P protein component
VLPRELRLKERHRFQAVYRRGRFWSNPEMAVHVLSRPESGTQFGFVVGKKVGGAVQRNRVRRLLREACRALVPGVRAGVDVVIVGRPAATGAALAQLKDGMRALFQRAGIWTETVAAAPPQGAPAPSTEPAEQGDLAS